ncbi:5'-3' exonuclease [Tessaracoccus rhinocerotis]|uniref:5'-3' exonuclease n=2 Tax=Tessaracoccus rhinocerotis TaxID=1689449 RepID=A0A553JYJ7_9ACTN|nr:5'-3' exonuclease [Tessaracoccus rhinocerotis]
MVFDTSYLYFRAFFGVPSSMRAPDGSPINAVKGLLDSIARLVDQYRPDLVACAWDDDWRPEWRTELIPSYKAHRVVEEVPAGIDQEETPDELAQQVPVIRDVLQQLGLAVIGAARHEADDVLASLAAQHSGRSLVVTGDRDLFQLVDDDISVVYVGRGVAKHEMVDDDWLVTKYDLPANRYVDLAVLRGDPSDGLPGVKGVGEKSAAKLLKQFGSLTELVEAAVTGTGVMPPATRARIVEGAEYILKAEVVVEVVKDLELPPPTALPLDVPEATAEAIQARLGLGGTMDRIVAALAQRGA